MAIELVISGYARYPTNGTDSDVTTTSGATPTASLATEPATTVLKYCLNIPIPTSAWVSGTAIMLKKLIVTGNHNRLLEPASLKLNA